MYYSHIKKRKKKKCNAITQTKSNSKKDKTRFVPRTTCVLKALVLDNRNGSCSFAKEKKYNS